MSREEINIGNAPNDGNGDPVRTAFAKVNAMTEELYQLLGDTEDIFLDDPLSGNPFDAADPLGLNFNQSNLYVNENGALDTIQDIDKEADLHFHRLELDEKLLLGNDWEAINAATKKGTLQHLELNNLESIGDPVYPISQSLDDGMLPAAWTSYEINFYTSSGGYAHFSSIDSYLITDVIDLSQISDAKLTFEVAKYGVGGNGPITVEFSEDGGTTWDAGTYYSPTPDDSDYLQAIIEVDSHAANFRIRFRRNISSSQKRLKNVTLSGVEVTGSGRRYSAVLVDNDLVLKRYGTAVNALKITEANDIGIAQALTVGGITTLEDALVLENSAGSTGYISGILGTGTRWDTNVTGGTFFEVDNMRIRNELRVHIFKKDIVKASNGYLFITDSALVAETSVVTDANDTIKLRSDEGNATFDAGDLLWFKSIDESGGGLQVYGVKITIGSQVDSGTTNGKDWAQYGIQSVENGGKVIEGGTIVRVSGGYLMNDASSQYAPFLDVYDQVATWADFQSTDKLKARLGNLEGVTDVDFGALSGYGLYSLNVYLKGILRIAAGSTGVANLSDAGALAVKNDAEWSTDITGIGKPADNADVTSDQFQDTLAQIENGAGFARSGLTQEGNVRRIIRGSDITTGSLVDGLNMTGTYLGYYSAGWNVYIKNDGSFLFQDGEGRGISYLASAGDFTIDVENFLLTAPNITLDSAADLVKFGDTNNYMAWQNGLLSVKGAIYATSGHISDYLSVGASHYLDGGIDEVSFANGAFEAGPNSIHIESNDFILLSSFTKLMADGEFSFAGGILNGTANSATIGGAIFSQIEQWSQNNARIFKGPGLYINWAEEQFSIGDQISFESGEARLASLLVDGVLSLGDLASIQLGQSPAGGGFHLGNFSLNGGGAGSTFLNAGIATSTGATNNDFYTVSLNPNFAVTGSIGFSIDVDYGGSTEITIPQQNTRYSLTVTLNFKDASDNVIDSVVRFVSGQASISDGILNFSALAPTGTEKIELIRSAQVQIDPNEQDVQSITVTSDDPESFSWESSLSFIGDQGVRFIQSSEDQFVLDATFDATSILNQKKDRIKVRNGRVTVYNNLDDPMISVDPQGMLIFHKALDAHPDNIDFSNGDAAIYALDVGSGNINLGFAEKSGARDDTF